jgi:hypothetical protein
MLHPAPPDPKPPIERKHAEKAETNRFSPAVEAPPPEESPAAAAPVQRRPLVQPAKAPFDRKAYQRELMRKRRAKR